MSIFRVFYRLFCLLTTSFVFLAIGIGLDFVYKRKPRQHKRYLVFFIRHWAKWFCRFLNIRIQVRGKVNQSPGALIVANHVGSPDIFVIGSCFKAFFLSQHEVAKWPIAGILAQLGRTIFVDRSRKHQVKETIENIAKHLKEGFSVVVFPEGQATNGSDVLPFKTSHFEAAVFANRPVLPIAIRYLDANHPSVACWTETTFAKHFLRLLTNPFLDAEIRVFSEISPEIGRKKLASESHAVIQKMFRKNYS